MKKILPRVVIAVSALCLQVSAAPSFSVELSVSDLLAQNGGDGSRGTVIIGYTDVGFLGRVVGPAGDVNADGVDDMLLGSRSSMHNGNVQAGRAFVVFGDSNPQPEFELFALDPVGGGDGSAGFLAGGIWSFASMGSAVAAVGDTNSDGIDDILLGSGGINIDDPDWGGQSYLIFGGSTGFTPELSIPALFESNGGTGEDGIVFHAGEPREYLGASVANVGDVNADGHDDLILGAPQSNRSMTNPLQYTGAAYLVYGSADPFPVELDLATLRESVGGDGSVGTYFIGAGIGVRDGTGSSVSYIGDVNADGIDDLAIGAAEAGELQPRGGVYIVFGRPGGFGANFDLEDLLPDNGGDGSQGFFIRGSSSTGYAGGTLCSAGDFNGDGINDVIISSRAVYSVPGPIPFETSAARAYLIFGSDTGFEAMINAGDLFVTNGGDGSVGVVMTGEETPADNSTQVCGAGDINDDGFDDIVLGASAESHQGLAGAGRAYVLYGKSESFPAQIDLTSLLNANGGDGSSGFVVHGSEAQMKLGSSVGSVGDFNNDGIADLAIGAIGAQYGGSGSGAVFVVFGRVADDDGDGVADQMDNCLLVANPAQTDSDLDGYGNVCDADFNNDNIVNFIDLSLLGQAFLSGQKVFDVNDDGVVNFLDVSLFENLFLSPPGPSGLVPSTAQ